MSITVQDVETHADGWFKCVGSGGTGDEQAAFHMFREARVFAGNGQSYSLDEHHELHQQWTHESHILGSFQITPINADPERVRADGTVYWQARLKDGPSDDSRISIVAAESWMIERTRTGLKFLLYITPSYQLLPDSAMPVSADSTSGDFIANR